MANRLKARRLDAPYDFRDVGNPHHRKALAELNAPINLSELKFHATRLKNNKRFGIDDIHTILVKQAFEHISHILMLVYNYWKDTANVTPTLNERLIIPLQKPGKPDNVVKGLRHVSIENILWKLHEMIIDHRGIQYLIKMNIISKHQFAVKKGAGSEDCLVSITNNITSSLSQHQPVHIATFDSSDAYDSMRPDITEDKLRYHAGMNDKAIIMFNSVSMNRTSRTMVNGTVSSQIKTRSGPFQGAPPSATLWVVYINPLLKRIESTQTSTHSEICARALMDDVTIFTKMKTNYLIQMIPTSVQFKTVKMFQETIDLIIYYLNVNNVPTNNDKTQLMTIHEQNYHWKLDLIHN